MTCTEYREGDRVGYTRDYDTAVRWGAVDRVEDDKVWCFFDKVATWIDSHNLEFHVPKEYC